MSHPTEAVSAPPSSAVRPMASTYAYFATITVLGLVSASLGPTLLGFAANTNSEIGQISILFLARSTGFMLGSLVGGRALDLLPAHWVFTAAILAISCTLFVAPVLPILWMLAAVMLLVGMSMGTLDMGSNTLLVWVHGSKVGPYMQGLHLLWSLGAFLSPIIVVQIIGIGGGIQGSYWLLACLFLPLALWIVRLPSPSSVQAGAESGAAAVNYRLVGLIAFFLFAYVGAEVSFGGWLFTYATTLGLTTLTEAGYLTSLFWGAVTLGRVVAIPAAARMRPSTILLIDLAGCLLSVAVILVWSDSSTALWAGTFGMGFFMATIFPTVILWAARRMTLRGSITRWFFAGASLGAMIFPWLVGQFFEWSGPQVTMVIVFGLLLLDLALFWVLMRYGGEPLEAEA